ncbi:hypothetical protein ACM66B_006458 [Microbotryomycetes sp. NB124-2]
MSGRQGQSRAAARQVLELISSALAFNAISETESLTNEHWLILWRSHLALHSVHVVIARPQLKPLKAPKKGPKGDEDEDDAAFKAKQKADAAALKAMQDRAAKGGPLGTGLKKSGKK